MMDKVKMQDYMHNYVKDLNENLIDMDSSTEMLYPTKVKLVKLGVFNCSKEKNV